MVIQASVETTSKLSSQFETDCVNLVNDLKDLESLRQGIKLLDPDQTIKDYVASTTYAEDSRNLLNIRNKKEAKLGEFPELASEKKSGTSPKIETKKNTPIEKKKVASQPVVIIPSSITVDSKINNVTETINKLFSTLSNSNKWKGMVKLDSNLVSLQLFRVFTAFSKPGIKFTKSIEDDARLVLNTTLHHHTTSRLLLLKKLNPVESEFKRVCEFFATHMKDYQDVSA